jgi:hypothetical protein
MYVTSEIANTRVLISIFQGEISALCSVPFLELN